MVEYDGDKIRRILGSVKRPGASQLAKILTKARKLQGLSLEETAALMAVRGKGQWAPIYKTAFFVKQRVYGRRIVLFAPLYLSNRCLNNCLYCPISSFSHVFCL